jgi:cytoplasmic iron level regulating protein YaaA (DUF328/UPF0246 family)
VYQGLKAEKLSKSDLKYAQERVAILSGLYGILRPLDLMQPYRLEMGTSWEITKKKNSLYKFWKETLTTEIAKMLEASGSGYLLNLASKEYSKAVDLKHQDVPVLAPQFKEERNGEFKMISFFAKEARGMMAAYAIKNRISEPEDLKGFDYGNYGFNERLSDTGKHKWVFTRKTT